MAGLTALFARRKVPGQAAGRPESPGAEHPGRHARLRCHLGGAEGGLIAATRALFSFPFRFFIGGGGVRLSPFFQSEEERGREFYWFY